MKRIRVFSAFVLFALLSLDAPASAHSELETTTPANGARLEKAPNEIVLKFNEPVEAALGNIRVIDGNAKTVSVRGLSHVNGDLKTLQVKLPSISDGLYTATWRVTSADAHPVQGAFTFGVGNVAVPSDGSLAQQLLTSSDKSGAASLWLTVTRWFTYAGLCLLVGAILFQYWGWDGRTRTIGFVGCGFLITSALFALPLQGAVSNGGTLADGFTWSSIRSAAEIRFGAMALVRAAVAAILVLAFTRMRSRPLDLLKLVGAAAAGVTVAVGGHAATGDFVPLALVTDLIHIGAMSTWIGGLVVVAFDVVRSGSARAGELVGKFSKLAFWSVIAVVVSGSVQGWRQVRTIDALTSTTYGRTLMIKVGIVAFLVLIGWGSRQFLARWLKGVDAKRLKTAVLAEVGVAVCVLVMSSVLVNAVPAHFALARPFTATAASSGVVADIIIDPAKVGRSTLHLYATTDSGQAATLEEANVKISMPSKGIASLDIPLVKVTSAHYASYGFDIPVSGTWNVVADLRTGPIDQVTINTQFKAN